MIVAVATENESEVRIAVGFRRELHIGRGSKRSNTLDRADAAHRNLAGRTDIDPIRHAIEC